MKGLTKLVSQGTKSPSVKGEKNNNDRIANEPSALPNVDLPPNIIGMENVTGASPQIYNEQLNERNNSAISAADINGGDLLLSNLRFARMSPPQMGQVYYPPAQFGLYGDMSSLGMATPEQMGLALQLIQQMNQNAARDAESNNRN